MNRSNTIASIHKFMHTVGPFAKLVRMQPSPRLMDIELVNICNFRCNFHCNFRCLAYAGSMGEKALSAVRGHDACGQLCRHQPLWSAA